MLLEKAYDALPPDGALIVYERLIDNERRVTADGLLQASRCCSRVLAASISPARIVSAGWVKPAFRDMRVVPLTPDESMTLRKVTG